MENIPSKCSCTNVRRGARAITKFYDSVMQPSGIKVTQFSILRNIINAGPLNVSELSVILRLDRTTLVRNLKYLELNKFIESSAGQDARSRVLKATESGRHIIEEAIPYWEQAQAAIRRRLGSADHEKLIALLMKVESLNK